MHVFKLSSLQFLLVFSIYTSLTQKLVFQRGKYIFKQNVKNNFVAMTKFLSISFSFR